MSEPEDSMRRCCDALVAGDVFTAMAAITPQALNELLLQSPGGVGMGQLPTATSYEIESHDTHASGEHRFQVRFQTNQGEIAAHAVWAQVDGVWKITSLGLN